MCYSFLGRPPEAVLVESSPARCVCTRLLQALPRGLKIHIASRTKEDSSSVCHLEHQTRDMLHTSVDTCRGVLRNTGLIRRPQEEKWWGRRKVMNYHWGIGVCPWPRAIVTQYYTLRGFKKTGIYSLTVVQAGSPREGVRRVGASEGCERAWSHASPLASSGLLAILGIPWLINSSLQSLPFSADGILPVCLCTNFPFL